MLKLGTYTSLGAACACFKTSLVIALWPACYFDLESYFYLDSVLTNSAKAFSSIFMP